MLCVNKKGTIMEKTNRYAALTKNGEVIRESEFSFVADTFNLFAEEVTEQKPPATTKKHDYQMQLF